MDKRAYSQGFVQGYNTFLKRNPQVKQALYKNAINFGDVALSSALGAGGGALMGLGGNALGLGTSTAGGAAIGAGAGALSNVAKQMFIDDAAEAKATAQSLTDAEINAAAEELYAAGYPFNNNYGYYM